LVYDNAENAYRNGAEIHTLTKVVSIEKARVGFEVFTSSGIFKAKYVVNAPIQNGRRRRL
ncbi:hypothetical protein ACFL3J_00830, partial [Candidatus Omnitrophota bacterium]